MSLIEGSTYKIDDNYMIYLGDDKERNHFFTSRLDDNNDSNNDYTQA